MPTFEDIYATACARKGGEKQLKKLLPTPASKRTLGKLPTDRYLAEFCKKIFQSGFVWRVVEAKWDNFEEVFWDFEVSKLIMMPDDMLERKASDKAIIRNYRKVLAIRENAFMIHETEQREGVSFGKFIANWPSDNIVGLWQYLKQHGSRLGGNTGPYALRSLGVNSFLLSRDVEGFLRSHKVIDGGINTKSSLARSQQFFNDLHDQSGRSLSELSRMVSYCHGDNYM
tara:strand:- start:487 stop:1170 length:684 start_codon:yes stop_codon:yes gene_type:complete